MADDDGFITLPPGIADSGTLRRPRVERPRTVEREEIVFVPTVPGVAPVFPSEPQIEAGVVPPEVVAPEQARAEPQVTEPMPNIPTFTLPPPPAPAAAEAAADEDFGETRVSVSRHAHSGWRLVFPGTGPVGVDSPLFLGRNPAATIPGAKTMAIDDPEKSLSKTHALVEVNGGVLYVTDLDSTNGVWVVPEGGEAIEVVPGTRVVVPAGADLELGDVVIQVEHG
ncbi:MAG: FHA domain-containing protein [Pseudolysinimonas sp.]